MWIMHGFRIKDRAFLLVVAMFVIVVSLLYVFVLRAYLQKRSWGAANNPNPRVRTRGELKLIAHLGYVYDPSFGVFQRRVGELLRRNRVVPVPKNPRWTPLSRQA